MTGVAQTTARPSSRAGSASVLPLAIGLGALLLSLIVALVVVIGFSAPVELLFGIPLPLVLADFWWLSLVGYLLTPLLVVACYGWDVISQRNGLRRHSDFVMKAGYSSALRWALWPAVVIGVWHILNLSVPLSEAWGAS